MVGPVPASVVGFLNMTTGAQVRNRRSDAIDAVRGVAILLVVSRHWFEMPFGWTGVDLFFVLSGYLIGGILIDNRNAPAYFRTFYARRFFRIVPLYLLFLLATLTTFEGELPIWRYLTFTQNFAWVPTGLIGAGPRVLTWSLAVEEQFYMILPAVVWLLPNRRLLILSACLVIAAPFCRWLLILTYGIYAPYLMLPGRMDMLFSGVLVACLVRQPYIRDLIRRRIAIVLLLSGGAFAAFLTLGIVTGFYPASLPMYFVGYSLICVSFGCGVLAIAVREHQTVKHKLLCATGIAAYSIYLCHQLVLSTVLDIVGPMTLTTSLATILGTAGIATACWIVIERPLIQFARTRWRYGDVPRPPELAHATSHQ
jgi:peptidoglycan/LPS O-acetylase OafA/YrhL